MWFETDLRFFMPPSSKKLEGHIASGDFIRLLFDA